jgi:collagen type III alpha
MATVAPPKTVQSIKDRKKATTGGHAASEALIAERIREAQTALWRAELSRTLLIPVVTSLIAITLWAAMDQWVYSPGKFVRSIALLGAIAGLVYWFARRVWPLLSQSVRPEYAAQSLEHDLPELRHSLTSYVSLHDDHDREGVRGVVVRSIGVRAASQLQSHDVQVPSEASGSLRWWLAVAAALALAAAYAVFSPKDTFQSTKRLLLPLASIAPPSRVEITDVLPGEVTVLAGRPFEVSAKINGLRKGEEALVEYGPNFVNARPLDANNETGRLASAIVVDASGKYRIVAGDCVAGPYAVTTRDVPTVVIDRIEISPPAYTRLPERSTSGGAIVGEENSIAKIVATTNRPIDRARVEFNPRSIGDKVQASGGILDMTISGDGSQIEASFPLKLAPNRSVVTIDSYRLRVWDSADNENLEPIVYPVRIIADLVPEISIAEPQAILTEVPINSAQRIEVLALDPDYGLKQIDLQIKRGVDVVKNETLWSSAEGERGNQIRVWMFEPKALGLRVGETVDVFAIASDNRHDSNGTPAANVVTTDSIALRIVEPVDESQLPRFDRPEDQADGQAKQQPGEDGQQGESSEKNQSGQGGQGGQGEGQQGKGQQGDGQQGDGQQAKSGTDPNGGGMSKDDAPQGDPSDSQSAQEGNERQGNERQADGGAGNNSEQPPGGSGQKPQHDGDAFERIRDYINEAKNQQQGDGKSQQNGEQQRPQSSPDGKSGSSDGATGNQQGNEPQAGDKQAGDKQAGDKQAGDKQAGDKQAGEQAPNGKPSGEGAGEDAARDEPNGAASSETATPPSKPSGTPDQTQSEPRTDGEQDGSSQPGEMNSKDAKQDSTKPSADGQEKPGDSSTPSQGEGDQGKQNQQGKQDPQKGQGPTKGNGDPRQAAGNKEAAGEDAASEGDAKEGAANEDGSSEDSPSEGKGDNGKGGEKADSDAKQKQSKADPPDDQQGTPGEALDGKPNPNGDASAEPRDSTSSSGGFGGDDGINTDPQDTARPPDPVDVESARQATDMVLDYLDSQRETPDPELLERLDWTPEELRAFADRWNRLRGSENGAAGDQKQIEEALRSLGIRSNQTGPIGKATERDDTMRGLKDAGNRTPAPAIHRDAFDAFRRNANRQ